MTVLHSLPHHLPRRFACAAILALVTATTACDEKNSDPGDDRNGPAGETDGDSSGDTDGPAPEVCAPDEARTCEDDDTLVQYCGDEGFDACPCIDPAEQPCEPGDTKSESCGLEDIPDATFQMVCEVVDCVPQWVEFDYGDDFESHPCNTPLAFVPAGTTPAFLPADDRFFAVAANTCATDWPTADTPWLARDLDGNGRIDGGHELFGSGTWLDGRRARHGFEALAPLDENGDGVLDRKDPAFSELVLWADADADRRSRPGELLPLSAVGIDAIPLSFDRRATCDDRGNCGIERVDLAAGRGQIVDLYLPCR